MLQSIPEASAKQWKIDVGLVEEDDLEEPGHMENADSADAMEMEVNGEADTELQ